MSGPLQAARDAWGDALPDWVEVLAVACARSSQAKVARALGRSATVVSQVLNRKYPAEYDAIEERVRGVFQHQTILCPSLGDMGLQVCQDWRQKARSFVIGNPLRGRMYRACHRCPRYLRTQGAPEEEAE